jgi:hypothetical protein
MISGIIANAMIIIGSSMRQNRLRLGHYSCFRARAGRGSPAGVGVAPYL